MCTRFFIEVGQEELKDILQAVKDSLLVNKFNHAGHPVLTEGEIRPTDVVPVIAPNPHGKRSVYPMKWGYTVSEHKTKLFNARCETASTKSTFRDDWRLHRCIVPASHYFEWEHIKMKDGKTKTGRKYAIQSRDACVTWLCGLYRIENGLPVFVILTRQPGESVKHIHDRMPLILPPEKIDAWIDPNARPEALLPYALTETAVEYA